MSESRTHCWNQIPAQKGTRTHTELLHSKPFQTFTTKIIKSPINATAAFLTLWKECKRSPASSERSHRNKPPRIGAFERGSKTYIWSCFPPRPLQPCAVWVITEAVLKMERNTAAISVWKYQITPVSLRMFENDPVRSSYSSPVPAQIWGWNSYCTSNTNVEVSPPLHPREEGRGPKRRGGAGLCAWDTCLPSPCSTACSSFTAKTKGTPPSSRLS